jgi:hypothetical protein
MRNIRDYKAQIRPDGQTLGSASPFNIAAESLTLANFSRDDVAELYAQHTDATAQLFDDDAVDLVFEQTQGQPWLVNAIANEVIVEILDNDYARPVTVTLVRQAVQRILLNRPTHIDSLMERLREPRVRNVIQPMITGEAVTDLYSDDFLYTQDLGLITLNQGYSVVPANPIYAEVIIRLLADRAQVRIAAEGMPYILPRYLKDGAIDVDFLLNDFCRFWRDNSDIWTRECPDYPEAAAVLVLCAFLQRVTNGSAHVVREMGTGRGRIDLCILYKDRRYPIEVKICRPQHDNIDTLIARGIEQTARYMTSLDCSRAWLLLFDKRPDLSWDDRQSHRQVPLDPTRRISLFTT